MEILCFISFSLEVNDTVEFVSSIISTEMNSATDNPIVFTGEINYENLLGGREEDDNNNNGKEIPSIPIS